MKILTLDEHTVNVTRLAATSGTIIKQLMTLARLQRDLQSLELSRVCGIVPQEMHRILNPTYPTKTDTLVNVLDAMGYDVHVTVIDRSSGQPLQLSAAQLAWLDQGATADTQQTQQTETT